MQENFDLVQRGFRILLPSMSGYIGQQMNKAYKKNWWEEVRRTLDAWDGHSDLPTYGNYDELVDSLDIACCLRLIDRKWGELFRNLLPQNCRAWAKELMGMRNIVAHIGTQDLDQPTAERALDTMALLCAEIDPESVDSIREYYKEVRARADGDKKPIPFSTLNQPESDSVRGELKEGSLLSLVGTEIVQTTKLTRKVTYGGKTQAYPVYRIRLDALYYNDQNDRIATWISRYESENGKDSLSGLNREVYNRIIEGFIIDSNPEAITKTQKNISLVGQRESGVTLADGRIVDGNRRFTCLRRIQRESNEPIYFETVIMDVDIREDKKQIKLLELAIQHGEEKKVDYDLIDYAVGTYRDVMQTKLLTMEEYASGANESIAEVKKRIDVAGFIFEFLSYVKLPEQYHIARDLQVYSLFQEMMQSLRLLDDEGKVTLKMIAFNNVLLRAIPDQRKFIRDIKGLIKNEAYVTYFEEQQELGEIIEAKLAEAEIHNKSDLDKFAEDNADIREELLASMERALLKSRSQLLKERPAENVAKGIALMMDIDPRQFDRLSGEEKATLKGELEELTKIIESFKAKL